MKWLSIGVVCLMVFVIECTGMSRSEIEDFSNFLTRTSQLDEPLKKGTNADDDLDDEVVSDDAWETSGKFEGDLILNERQRRLIIQDVVQGLARNGLKDSTKRWPDNEVTYYIQREHFSGDQVQAIMDGIQDLAQASCIKFKPYRKGDRDAVVIQGSRRGCFSQVGYQGGYQVLNLSGRHPVGRGCFRHGTVVHELLHTLGFYHMQSSADRDDYIDVHWDNIIERAKNNFRKYNAFAVSDFGVGYDYESVLHYSRRAFSKNGRDTLVPKTSGASIGQRIGLSDKDTQKLNKMYCDADPNNSEASEEETTQKAAAEKKDKPSKNKPFMGQGIGYHQGKTVVIKLPAAKTFQLPASPTFHVFDYFSKAPETVSPTLVEGFGAGKEIEYSYKPHAAINTDEYEETTKLNTNIHDNSYDKLKQENTYGENDLTRPPESKRPTIKENQQEKDHSYEITKGSALNDDNSTDHSVKFGKDLNEAFQRLGKIIRTHVYPSHTPNLNVFKMNSDNIEFYKPDTKYETEQDIAKEVEAFRSSVQAKVIKDEKHDTKKRYPQKPQPFIKSVYSSDTFPHNKYHDPYEADGYDRKDSSTDDVGDTTDQGDSSYGTLYPLKQIYKVKEENIQTPEFATLENLVYNHNLSSLYNPKFINSNDQLSERKHRIFANVVPLGDEKDHPDHTHGKYTLYKYTYPEDHTNYYEHPSEKLYNYYGPEKEDDGSPSSDKKAYSIFGVLVPIGQDWHKDKDYDKHKESHLSENYRSNEDVR